MIPAFDLMYRLGFVLGGTAFFIGLMTWCVKQGNKEREIQWAMHRLKLAAIEEEIRGVERETRN